MVLGILILALTAGAFLHFIIDGIIAPSAQMSTRIELFTRAEELELIARKNARSFDSKIHEVMRTAVHNLISGMSRYTVVSVGGFVRRYQHDLEFRKSVDERMALIDSCQLPEIKAHRKRVCELADRTLRWNSIGWSIYVLPIAFFLAMYRSTHRVVKALLAAPATFDRMDKFHDDAGNGGVQSQYA